LADARSPQQIRSRWRALPLVIKAKLESIDLGIFNNRGCFFLADTVLPDRQTVADYMRPQIESPYKTGAMPPLLPYYEQNDR
jgi:hypothetical protein